MYIWVFSRSVGAASATTLNTRGLTRSVMALMTPPLPAPSRPSKTTQTLSPLYLTHSCSFTSSTWSFLSRRSYSLVFSFPPSFPPSPFAFALAALIAQPPFLASTVPLVHQPRVPQHVWGQHVGGRHDLKVLDVAERDEQQAPVHLDQDPVGLEGLADICGDGSRVDAGLLRVSHRDLGPIHEQDQQACGPRRHHDQPPRQMRGRDGLSREWVRRYDEANRIRPSERRRRRPSGQHASYHRRINGLARLRLAPSSTFAGA